MSPDEAIHRLYGILGTMPRAKQPRVEQGWVWTKMGWSAASRGETRGGFVEPGPGRCLITVRSISNFALIDWGVNRRNVEAVLNRLSQQYEIDRLNAALAAERGANPAVASVTRPR